ncbi:PTS sugar transporter subunit IIA [Streptomyces sp. enrichment culture]|uniref:PTS sugar transporter subunit IIA n=1 Tax=Streptomyces sp. enrichment culture TaxID=1795815 RepID=UPI003F56EA8A
MLVDEGISTAEYTEAMVRNVEEDGPYIVLAPGFALARTRPFEAVLKTGMSWVRLASPVAFGHETKDPVHLAGTRNTDRVLGGEAYDRGVHAFGHEEPGPRRDVAAFGGRENPRGDVLPCRGRGAPPGAASVTGRVSCIARPAGMVRRDCVGGGSGTLSAGLEAGPGPVRRRPTVRSSPAWWDEEPWPGPEGRPVRAAGPRPVGWSFAVGPGRSTWTMATSSSGSRL